MNDRCNFVYNLRAARVAPDIGTSATAARHVDNNELPVLTAAVTSSISRSGRQITVSIQLSTAMTMASRLKSPSSWSYCHSIFTLYRSAISKDIPSAIFTTGIPEKSIIKMTKARLRHLALPQTETLIYRSPGKRSGAGLPRIQEFGLTIFSHLWSKLQEIGYEERDQVASGPKMSPLNAFHCKELISLR